MMTELEKLESRLAALEQEVILLRATRDIPTQDAIVGADYVARLFNISETAVVNGRFGTNRIPRCRQKPVGFKKSEVDKALREASKSVEERAAENIAKAKLVKRRKRSIIKRKETNVEILDKD